MKKTLAIILALVMILSLATVVMADGTDGKITIKNPIDKATYAIYQILVLESYDVDAGAYKYSADSDWADWLVTQTSYIKYDDEADTWTWVENADAADFAQAALAYAEEEGITADKTYAVNGDDTVVFGELSLGYYLVDSSVGALCSLDTTDNEVDIDEKNSVPTVDKTITGEIIMDDEGKNALAQVGNTVDFQVNITVGDGAQNYVFHDTMSDGLTYNNDVKVYVGGAEVDSANYDATTKGTDTITITFNNDYVETLNKGTVITVKYSATINENAVTEDPENNTASLDYGDEHTTTSSETDVYTYEASITVKKVDGAGNALAGAGFVLMNSENKYYNLAEGVVTWVDNIDNATEFKTEEVEGVVNNTLNFTGLTVGTYTLVEKTVPAGYNPAENIEIVVSAEVNESGYTVSYEWDDGRDDETNEITVVNKSGSELPSTGGIGTTLFYVFGTILVVGTAIVLVTKRRMAAEQ